MKRVCVEEMVSDRQNGALDHRARFIRELLQKWCDTELKWVTYERCNGPNLWGQVARHVNGYLGVLWLTGILRTNHLSEAFCVTCDRTTMTEVNIREGLVICHVTIALENRSESFFYRIFIPVQTCSENPLAVA